jgi:beta-lactamase class A
VQAIDEVRAIFDRAEVTGKLHVRRIPSLTSPNVEHSTEHEVSLGGDDPVVLASVFKIAVAVAYARAVDAGTLDPRERVLIGQRYRIGGIGTGGCDDDVELSWRDAAAFMMSMSDNATTDALGARLGLSAVREVLVDAGLTRTRIDGWCEDVFASMARDLGVGSMDDDLDAYLAAFHTPLVDKLGALDPATTVQASTPAEVTSLLSQVWTNTIATPAACATVRDLMARQVWDQRLSSGFGAEVTVAGKTGTLPKVRNEAGVVTFPDGSQYAVAVFLRLPRYVERDHRADHAIGEAAAAAVAHLRGRF